VKGYEIIQYYWWLLSRGHIRFAGMGRGWPNGSEWSGAKSVWRQIIRVTDHGLWTIDYGLAVSEHHSAISVAPNRSRQYYFCWRKWPTSSDCCCMVDLISPRKALAENVCCVIDEYYLVIEMTSIILWYMYIKLFSLSLLYRIIVFINSQYIHW
jgi:hypothetical protein